MNARKTSTGASSKKGVALRSLHSGNPSLQPTSSGLLKKRLLIQKNQALFRRHLSALLDQLFAEFTGVHFHIAWALSPSPLHKWEARSLPTGCTVCCRLSGSPLLKDCRICGPKQLARTLDTDGDGHIFTCRLGVRNFWLPIRLRGETLGIAYLQALEHSPRQQPARKRAACGTARGPDRSEAKVMSRLKFARATRFLQLIVQYLESSSLADLQKEDLDKVQQALCVFENVQAHLRKKLNGLMPAIREVPPVAKAESRPQQVVHKVLERIHQDFARPLTLQKCARDLRVSSAYLSDLFSRSVGLPFKTCLTTVRIEKARELLSNPRWNISQVARAVGYASANRFRIAFKNVTGISPRHWRETLRMDSH